MDHLPPVYHRNQQLFSDYFLNTTLPQRQSWQALAETVAPVMQHIARIVESYTPTSNEAQLERELIQPILEALGHTFEVQPSLKTPDGTKRPDYVFYQDEITKKDHKQHKMLTDEILLGDAFAVGDAKAWDRSLDQTIKQSSGDFFSNKNPTYQIAFYMQHSGVTWGILTNGRLWRLYHRDTAHKLDQFYEVNLPALLATANPHAFMYFYAFFHRSAFDPHPLGVEAMRQESVDYALGVSEHLKQQVFDALRYLAQGFLDFPANNLTTTAAMLQEIYDHSLIVLYRLLFILYAESRDFLPVRENKRYERYYSLHAIARDSAEGVDNGLLLLPTTKILWTKITHLFVFINEGSSPLYIGTFNGGLFDPQRYPFLERFIPGDSYVQAAIDCLTRFNGQFIDYRDLSVRHLGTIYEGLLEYHLQPITDEPGWTIDLFNDAGERKRTGSYYTPDFIVDYVVEQAIGPLLQAAIAGVTDDQEKTKAILQLNILDPSMGSGHFLVETVAYLARFLVDQALPSDRANGEPDLIYWKRRVVQSCIYGVDVNPLAVELAKLSLWLATVAQEKPLSFLDHRLRCGNALVGAWVSHMQVLTNTQKGKKASPVVAGNGQFSMLEDATFVHHTGSAVSSISEIEHLAGDTIDDIREQERRYRQLREQVNDTYARFADVTTATHFGLLIDHKVLRMLLDYIAGKSLTAPAQFDAWIAAAKRIASQHRFFHWELEFPEVFFDTQGIPLGARAGFDLVLGNPPYVRQERIQELKPYLQTNYRSFHGVADLYIYFYEQAIRLLHHHGSVAYISSGTFARANFAANFRKFLPSVAAITTLIDFGENQPFKGAEMVRPSIVLLKKGQPQAPFRSLFLAGTTIPESLMQAVADEGIDCEANTLYRSEWVFQSLNEANLTDKIFATGHRLSSVVDGQLYCGIKTGLNDAFIIDQRKRNQLVRDDPSCVEMIKPMLRGQDLRPWYQKDEGRWVIVLPSGWTDTAYHIHQSTQDQLDEQKAWDYFQKIHLSLAHYLQPFAQRARERLDKGHYWWELRACSYYDLFAQPKIFWPTIGKLPRFSWDTQGKFINNSGQFIPTDDPSLLGILQSRVLWFAISRICTPLRLRAGLWQYQQFIQFIGRLPIPDAPALEREAIGRVAMQLTELAQKRIALHEATRRRILDDLCPVGAVLNQQLAAWWELDFPSFRNAIQETCGKDIPLKERGDWHTWLQEQRDRHELLTNDMVHLETDLNMQVYHLFDLSPEEIAVIERSTKYRYGEV